MDNPIHIHFKHMDRSDAVEAAIMEKCKGLEKFYHHIHEIRVVVEAPQAHHHKHGSKYRVLVKVSVPGKWLTAGHFLKTNKRHDALTPVIDDTFGIMARQLEDYARCRRGDVKHHEPPLQGWVDRLVRDRDFGFIRLEDGSEIYFNKNAMVHGSFSDLQPGTPVRLTVEEETEGESPRATSVSTIHSLQPADQTGARPAQH